MTRPTGGRIVTPERGRIVGLRGRHHHLLRRLVSPAACGGLALLVAGGSASALGAPNALATISTAAQPGTARPSAGPARSASRPALRGPSGLAVDAGNLWVTNRRGNTVTEINPSTRRRIRTIGTAREALARPVAIIAAGKDLFVANEDGARGSGSVTEINATNGAWVRTISAARDGFDHPVALARRGRDLFVVNKGGSVTELKTTGALIRRIAGVRYHFANPTAITVAGDDFWIANDSAANTVTEVNAVTGRLVRTVSNHGLSAPDGIASGAGRVWVADRASYAATEIDAATGAVVRTVSDTTGSYGFNHPSVTLVKGGNVYVVSPPGNTPMITKLSATDGAAAWFECNTNDPSPNFVLPSALALIGTDLFVANEDTSTTTLGGNGALVGNSITELNLADGGNAVAWMTNRSL